MRPDLVLDLTKDQSGKWCVVRQWEPDGPAFLELTDDPGSCLGSKSYRCLCFDSRALLDLEYPWDLVEDVQLAHDGSKNLSRLAASKLSSPNSQRYVELEARFKAHARAARSARQDLSEVSLFEMFPRKMLFELMSARCGVIRELAGLAEPKTDMRLMGALHRIELNGTFVDVKLARESVELPELGEHERKFFRSIAALGDDVSFAIVRTRYCPVGIKTGRIKVDGGFNTMGIPHGRCRDAIVSRFDGGHIFSIDFNAIDYRSIAAAVPELSRAYAGCVDFHEKSRELFDLHSMSRDGVKALTYISLYGGSVETCAKRIGCDVSVAAEHLKKMEDVFAPVHEFRRALHERAVADGYVALPSGRRVPVASDDHPGKVLGLYAQGHSSEVFESALIAVDEMVAPMRSKIIFPVHDELVIDVAPEEFGIAMILADVARDAADGPYETKCRVGRNYRECTS